MTYYDDIDLEMMESNSALRFIYMDDDELLSPTSSLHDSASLSIKSGGADWGSSHHNHRRPVMSPPLSPTSGETDHRAGHHHIPSEEEEEERPEKRKSIRKSLSHALTSPVRAATSSRGRMSSLSPRKATKNMFKSCKGNNSKQWRKQLDLPPDVTQDEAIAVLLAKELKMLDF